MPNHRLASVLGVLVLLAASSPAAARGKLDCRLEFSMSGWSLVYKTASGTGTVACSNGQRLPVRIQAKGGGLSVGKQKVEQGSGTFAGVDRIDEVLGSYATAEAHAGAAKSGRAQVMHKKGGVSLALAGSGRGWNLGVALGRFTIAPR